MCQGTFLLSLVKVRVCAKACLRNSFSVPESESEIDKTSWREKNKLEKQMEKNKRRTSKQNKGLIDTVEQKDKSKCHAITGSFPSRKCHGMRIRLSFSKDIHRECFLKSFGKTSLWKHVSVVIISLTGS